MPLIRKSADSPQPSSHREAGDVLTALTGGTREERWAAARAAPDLPGGIPALARALASEADPRVREAILTGLARVRTAESVQAVLPHLRSDDASLRTGALDALRAMPEAAAPHLEGLLSDADADVRLLACDLVRSLPDPEAARLLCGLLEKEREANVAAAALDVLAEIASSDALPCLARCAERFRDDPFLGFAIKVVTDRIGADPAGSRG
jgi:HEAT repeat protein